MAAKLVIQGAALKPFQYLLNLEQGKKNELLAALRSAAPKLRPDDFAKSISQVTNLNEQEVEEVIEVLFTLYSLIDYSERSCETVIHDVVEQLKSLPELAVDEYKYKEIEDFFSQALSYYHSIGISAKAVRLISQHDHVYRRAEVFTDIRSIFPAEHPETSPSAAVLVHTLKISHHTSGRSENFFVALDVADLQQLYRTVERALKKHQALSATLSEADIICIDPNID